LGKTTFGKSWAKSVASGSVRQDGGDKTGDKTRKKYMYIFFSIFHKLRCAKVEQNNFWEKLGKKRSLSPC
jgi:hypothetical protein